MPLPGIEVPLRASGRGALNVWKLEWTWTDGSGTVALDTSQSDRDPRVATPVADGGAGIVNVAFPKCDRMWILSKNLTPASATTGTQYRVHEVTDKNVAAGTCKVRFFDLDGTPTAVEMDSGDRYQLTLLLEYE